MKQYLAKIQVDQLGMSASLLCAIHCSILPILLTLGVFSGLSWMRDPWVEVLFIISAIGFATISQANILKQHNHTKKTLFIMLIGFILIAFSHSFGETAHLSFTALGGLIVAAAHYMNWRWLQSCKSCSH